MTVQEISNKNRSRLLISLCLIHFLLGLDINIVSVSCPSISSYFNINAGIVTRVIWIYFLVLTGLMLIFGRIGDIKGFRKIYTAGIIVFISGSALASIPLSFNFLIFSRVIQAVGAAVLFSLTPAVIALYFPEKSRGKIFGLNYSFTALGGIIGRAASGFIISEYGWNSIFYLNIPTGLISLYLIYRFLPDNLISDINNRFDIYSAVLVSSGLFLLMLFLNTGNQWGWTSSPVIFSFVLSVLFLSLFILRQIRSDSPVLDLKIFKNKNISYSVGAFVFIYIITNGMIYIVPFYLQWIKFISIKETGLLMAVPSVMQVIFGFLSGKFSDENSIKKICSAGIIFIMVSLIFHIFLSASSPVYFIIFTLAFYGASVGFFIPANTNNIMSGAPSQSRGSVSGFMTTSIRLGSSFGALLFSSVFVFFVPVADPVKSGVSSDLMLDGFRWVFITGIISAVAALILILNTVSKKTESQI